MSIQEKIREFREIVPAEVEIVAVSKFHPAEDILEAYQAGQRNFGESRVQELLEKVKVLPKDINWHFIGHLQTNKVKQIIGKTSLIESVDSLRLLELINKESEKAGVIANILLQAHVAEEETKFGFLPQEIKEIVESHILSLYKNLNICGLMGMASNTDDVDRIRKDFSLLKSLFDFVKREENLKLPNFNKLSMGMSGDWPLAVENGANIIRIGTAIFGSR